MKKRILSTLLALCMVLTLLPSTAWAVDETAVNNLSALQAAINSATGDLNLGLSGPPLTGTGTLTIPTSNSHNITINTYAQVMDGGTAPAIVHRGSGKLTIISVNSGTITSSSADSGTIVVEGGGSLEVNGGTISNTGNFYAICNKTAGNVTVSGGIVTATGICSAAIFNEAAGSVTISSGRLMTNDAGYTIHNNANGSVTVSGGIVENTDTGVGIYNNGTGNVTVSGGTVQNTNTGKGIYNDGTGNVTVSGGTVQNTSTGVGIYNNGAGNVTVSGGTVKSAGSGYAITNPNNGNLTLSGGAIENTGLSSGISGKCVIPSGTVTVKGGFKAMRNAPDLSGYTDVKIIASRELSGTPTETYAPNNIESYKYLKFEPLIITAPEATTNAATGISVATATLNGTVNAHNASTNVSFDYGTSTSYGSTVSASPSSVTGETPTSVTATLSGLTPNTTYHYRLKAESSKGSIDGADQTFTTSAITAPTATTNAASGISVAIATLNGIVNAHNASTSVSFDYGTSTSYGSTVSASPSSVSGETPTSVTAALSGLTPNTTYHYRVTAENSQGSMEGADQTFTTKQALPTVTAKNIKVTGATGLGGTYKIDDMVTVTWDNTASGDNNSGITYVKMNCSELGGGESVPAENFRNVWTLRYPVGFGHTDGSNQNISVTAWNATGTTTTEGDANVTVDTIAPTVTDSSISISGATGTGGAFKLGDTVTARWNNTASGDKNSDTMSGVTVNFSQFGGGSAVAATNSSNNWTATYTITSGSINGTNKNVSVTVTDDAGNPKTTADTSNAKVDTTVVLPNISINDSSVAEGNSGTQELSFTVSLSEASSNVITVDYATADGTATAGVDYTSNSGTLTFAPSETSKTIRILVNGDTKFEPNETVLILLSSVHNATISDGQGTGTITNDDPSVPSAPTIGTATVGDGQAVVTFTPPVSNGGAVITGYTVTSDPGGVTATGTKSPLTVTGLTNGTAYTFTVTAKNDAGDSAASASSNSVTPMAAPAITSQPLSQTVNAGEELTFSVSASGTTPLSYQWQCKTTEAASWSDIAGATCNSYGIASPTYAMNGYQYQCSVTNSAGTLTSNAATLTVNQPVSAPPTASTNTVSKTASIQKSVSFPLTTFPTGTYQVYENSSTATVHSSVTATLSGGTLTLTDKSNNISASTYYVSVTESGKKESARLALTVGAYATKTYTLTYIAGLNGTINGISPQTVNQGESGSAVTAVPNVGYHFLFWSDGVTTISRSDSNVKSDITITANFALTTYPITLNPNGGNALTPSTLDTSIGGKLVSLPTPTRSGSYRFDGWFTAESGGTAVTTNTVFSAATTIYAHWTYTGGGSSGGGSSSGGGATSNPTSTGSGDVKIKTSSGVSVDLKDLYTTTTAGKTELTLTSNTMDQFVASAIKEAKNRGQETNVTLSVGAPSASNKVAVGIPVSSIQSLAKNGEKPTLTIETPVASVMFDRSALETTVANADGATVILEVARVKKDTLTKTQQKLVGNKTVIDLTCSSNGRKISQLNGTATVSIPYTPALGENTSKLVIWYLADNGALSPIKCTYADGKVTFITTHFSVYVVAQNKFNDVKSTDWFYQSVVTVQESGLMNGISSDSFCPRSTTSRAMVATMLHRMAEKPSTVGTSLFADIDSSAYYAEAVCWASSKGIVSGMSEGLFEPERSMTREQLLTILYRYAGSPSISQTDMSQFSDANNISLYAKDAFAWAIQKGIIKGNDNGTLNPNATATRAEVAAIFSHYN